MGGVARHVHTPRRLGSGQNDPRNLALHEARRVDVLQGCPDPDGDVLVNDTDVALAEGKIRGHVANRLTRCHVVVHEVDGVQLAVRE